LKVIFKHAGKDASYTYNQAHSPKLLAQTLPSTNLKGGLVGELPSSRLPVLETTQEKQETQSFIPPLSTILSLHDLEASAKEHLSKKAWAYYSSAATDLVSERANHALWGKIWFRPRIMRNVKNVNTERIIHGVKSSTPFCVAPAAMAKLANEAGELAIAKSCAESGVIQCVSYIMPYIHFQHSKL
jgi:L-lactate dehydrogenase (cytochrome)